jgi:hypothetical protein
MSTLTAIESEFTTIEEAKADDVWFSAKVREALESKQPRVSHDEAMAQIAAKLDNLRKARAAGSMES